MRWQSESRINVLPAAVAASAASFFFVLWQQSSTFDLFLPVWKFHGYLCNAFVVSQRVLCPVSCPGLAAAAAAAPAIMPKGLATLSGRSHQMPNAKEHSATADVNAKPWPEPKPGQTSWTLTWGGLLRNRTLASSSSWGGERDRVRERDRSQSTSHGSLHVSKSSCPL